MKDGTAVALGLAACLLLGGCANKLTAEKSVSAGCAALPILDLSWRVFAPQIGATAEQMKWEQGAVATAQAACDTRGEGWEKVVEATLLALSDFLTHNGIRVGG